MKHTPRESSSLSWLKVKVPPMRTESPWEFLTCKSQRVPGSGEAVRKHLLNNCVRNEPGKKLPDLPLPSYRTVQGLTSATPGAAEGGETKECFEVVSKG